MQQLPDVHALSWAAMNIAHQEQFGNVLGLIYVILSLPASSADAERFQSTETQQEHHPIEPVRPTHRLDDCADDVTINRGIWSAHSPHTQSLGHRRVMTLTAAMCHMLTAVFPTQTLVRTHLD